MCLNGARHITLAGEVAYITAERGLVVIELNDPLNPKLVAVRDLPDARASAVQFRYLWVTDREGLKLFDVTDLRNPVAVPSGTVPLADARRVYLARTYAYVAAKQEGLGNRQHHSAEVRRRFIRESLSTGSSTMQRT